MHRGRHGVDSDVHAVDAPCTLVLGGRVAEEHPLAGLHEQGVALAPVYRVDHARQRYRARDDGQRSVFQEGVADGRGAVAIGRVRRRLNVVRALKPYGVQGR